MNNLTEYSLLHLPDEIISMILCQKEILIEDIYELQSTCLRLYNICQDDFVWRSKFKLRWKRSYYLFCDLMDKNFWRNEYIYRSYLEETFEDYIFSLSPYFISVSKVDDYHKKEIRSMCNNDFKKIYYYYESIEIFKYKPNFEVDTYNGVFLLTIEDFLQHELTTCLLKNLFSKPEEQSYKEAFYILNCYVKDFHQYSPKIFEMRLNQFINYYLSALENRYQYSIEWNNKKSDFWKKDSWTIFEIENILKTLLIILIENVEYSSPENVENSSHEDVENSSQENVDYSSPENVDHGCIDLVMQQKIGVKHCIIVLYTCICNRLGITITPLNDYEAVYYLTEEQASIIGFPILIIVFNATGEIKRSVAEIDRNKYNTKYYFTEFVKYLSDNSYFYEQRDHQEQALEYELLYFLDPNNDEFATNYCWFSELNNINYSEVYKIYTTMNFTLSEEEWEEFKLKMIESNSGKRYTYPIKYRRGKAVRLKYAVGCTYKDIKLERFYLVIGWRLAKKKDTHSYPYYIVLASDKSFRKIKEQKMRPTIRNTEFDQNLINQYFTGIENECYTLNEHLLREYPDEELYRIEHIKTVQFLKDFCLE